MSKFNPGDRVRVRKDAPVLAGEVGTVTDDPTNVYDTCVLPDGEEGTGTAMYDYELELLEPELEEHQLVSREELEARFVRQRNTIQRLQQDAGEYEQVIANAQQEIDDVLVQLEEIRRDLIAQREADKKLSGPQGVLITNELAQVEVAIVQGRLVVMVQGQATIDWSE